MLTFDNEKDLILFQGDSITDCNRSIIRGNPLGSGYVNLINHYLETHLFSCNIACHNRGIYGNRTIDLKLRWRRDCLKLEPTILSILVGINDTWRNYDLHLKTSPERFEQNYRYLLDSVTNKLPQTKLILMSPFLLPVSEEQSLWIEDLNPKIEIVAKLAKEYSAHYIPLQEIFNNLLSQEKNTSYWTQDGVHPTPLGHTVIAKEWLKLFIKEFTEV